ncbi:MAG: acetyl-coenzyme A carboxylase carboxyl transferase subunit alpha [Fimbriimonadales bacterium]|nr:MAG: acetyl-coenzyme A carboxylase carboxyl transferase subunit alpha [Fimbriimonadales bacterium]
MLRKREVLILARSWREWEKPLRDLEEGIARLRELREKVAPERAEALDRQIAEFEQKRDEYIRVKYSRLGAWERTLVARAESRPYTLDYIQYFVDDWVELHGDRRFADDKAIIGGLGRIEGQSCVIVGHQKGRDIKSRQFRNFGMAKPEGYRKAIRLFEMADRFGLPVVTFVDTPAADPGVESESRGISQAIAEGMFCMFGLGVPSVSVVIGEGGSGGAIGIAVANRVLMLENSIYSVIPPEGCAAILWRDPTASDRAAAALRLTAKDALELGIIDEIIPEGFGGAHRNPQETADNVKEAILRHLKELSGLSREEIREQRFQKYRKMGIVTEPASTEA